MQIGTQAVAIMQHVDGSAEAACHFDLNVLRAAVKGAHCVCDYGL